MIGPTKKRIPLLIISGVLLILGLVVLMNLAPPKSAIKAKAANENAQNRSAENQNAASAQAAAKEPQVVASPQASSPEVAASPEAAESKPAEANRGAVVIVQPAATPAAVDSEASASTSASPAASTVGGADMTVLKVKGLLIPVAGIAASQLRDTFNDGRSEGRQHQALDIMAAAGTPVLAATDGKVAKLFQSDKGGITLYELDSSGLYYFYYAHLQRYADGIAEGKQLKRGEVIGYVGDTGNAGAGNFHLHFAISKPSAPGKWSGGEPINPYPLFANR